MNTLVIMRGLPGSGKSTLAKELKENAEKAGYKAFIFSTDDFFMKDGVYQFNPATLPTAHLWNQKRAIMAMIEGHKDPNFHFIIIDNTCTQAWEARDYVKPAHLLNYKVEIKQPSTEWAMNPEECAKRTVHSVPLVTIQSMVARWETGLTLHGILHSKSPWEKA